jgi:hypothetical protein
MTPDGVSTSLAPSATTPPVTPPAATTPPVAAPVAAEPIVNTPAFGGGGTMPQSSMRNVFENINWVDMGLLILGTASLYYTIYYYRTKINMTKKELPEIANRVDEVESKVAFIGDQIKTKKTRTRRNGF